MTVCSEVFIFLGTHGFSFKLYTTKYISFSDWDNEFIVEIRPVHHQTLRNESCFNVILDQDNSQLNTKFLKPLTRHTRKIYIDSLKLINCRCSSKESKGRRRNTLVSKSRKWKYFYFFFLWVHPYLNYHLGPSKSRGREQTTTEKYG